MDSSLAVFLDNDDALLQWTADQLPDDCVGFGLQRKLTKRAGSGRARYLDNYSPPGTEAHQVGEHRSSAEWPFRSFSWTDHGVSAGDTVSYRVVPMLKGASKPKPHEAGASAWTEPRKVRSDSDTPYSAYFNRGFVISQFMSRYLEEHYPGKARKDQLQQFKKDIKADTEDVIRTFLSGTLRTTMLDLLEQVRKGDGHVYAALFELADKQLIDALAALGPRAHVVLANGSIQAKKGVPAKEARKEDQNKDGRDALLAKHVDVETTARFISPGALGHNKFLVVTDKDGNALRAWTGSTNWSTTGLCTQLNNGMLADDPAVARAYLKQWHDLRTAGSDHPNTLRTSNGKPTPVGGKKAGVPRSSVHFTQAPGQVDLKELGKIVRGAKQGLYFLMFIPGASGVLADVTKLALAKPKVLVRGVVSELPRGRPDEQTGDTTAVRVTLFGTPQERVADPQTFEVIQPRGREHTAAYWALETTREQFLSNIGHAIIHSKVLVVDPFSDDPTVVTGSHNFSTSASEKNDENFIVVQGDRALAEAYVVNVASAWRHYAGRSGNNAHAALTGIEYLRARLADQQREQGFWGLGA